MGLANSLQPSQVEEAPLDRVFINYQLFQRGRGHVQEQIIAGLQQICQDPEDM
ncbi:hypothetical protein BDW59DRAFT_152621, partial [Aspergillus cavernicola]